MINELHPKALALLDKLLDEWKRLGTAEVVTSSYGGKTTPTYIKFADLEHPIMVGEAPYLTASHNTQPTMLAIAKGQLMFHYSCIVDMQDPYGDHKAQHRNICTQLASMDIPGAETQLQALKEALNVN